MACRYGAWPAYLNDRRCLFRFPMFFLFVLSGYEVQILNASTTGALGQHIPYCGNLWRRDYLTGKSYCRPPSRLLSRRGLAEVLRGANRDDLP